MTVTTLYRQPVLLDPAQHRALRIRELTDWSVASELHAAFLTATEFAQAAIDYPILFVATGDRDAKGREMVAPVALLGLASKENLYVEGTRWNARYVPAFLRRYPFFSAPVAGLDNPGVFIDTAWSGLSETEGAPLFEPDDKPAAALTHALDFLERFEVESQRTRQFCERLLDLDILKDMRADVTLPGEHNLAVEGFLAVDEEKLQGLRDGLVVELHRKGLLVLLHMHLLSLVNIRQLVQRKSDRMIAAGVGTTAA